MTPEADKALSKAKIAVMDAPDTVFFTVIMLSLQHIWDDTQPTAYTNGTVIGYNSTFFLSIPPDERAGVVLHEVLHVALLHVLRSVGFDSGKYNAAADYVINLIVRKAGFKLPNWVLYDTRYTGMTTEQVYALLPDANRPQNKMEGDIRSVPEEDRDVIQDILDDIIVQAVTRSHAQGDKPGTVPGELERYVDKLVNPEVPWNRVLRHLMTNFAKNDYSYQRINRRFMPHYILPSLYSVKICDIAIGDDVSSSVTQAQHNHFAAESLAILKSLKPEKITFLQFNTQITQVDVLRTPGDMGRVRFKGGGGTNIEPLMKWAQENKPACLIVFTDGDFAPATTNPRVPVFWVINGNPRFRAPFGTVIPYTFNGPRNT
jgi:predicted metal-dependent peptidase